MQRISKISSMAVVNQSINKSTVYAEKVCTVFQWTLEDYSSLVNCYANWIGAPKFEVTGTGKMCRMYFRHSDDKKDAYLTIKFPCDVEYHTVKIEASIIDEYGRAVRTQQKLITVPTPTVDKAKQYTRYDFALIKVLDIPTTEGCLCNDTLTLCCKITVFKRILNTKLRTINQVTSLNNDVCKKLAEFLDAKTLTDVIVSVGDTGFPAHKLILAANSPVFEAMFNAEMTESLGNTVTITDIDPATFEAFLKCLYTGAIDEMDEHIGNLLIVADKYEVRSVKEMCEKCIMSRIVINNVIEYLLLAHTHGFEKLKQKALSFAIECGKELSDSKDFDKLCTYPDLVSQIFCKTAT